MPVTLPEQPSTQVIDSPPAVSAKDYDSVAQTLSEGAHAVVTDQRFRSLPDDNARLEMLGKLKKRTYDTLDQQDDGSDEAKEILPQIRTYLDRQLISYEEQIKQGVLPRTDDEIAQSLLDQHPDAKAFKDTTKREEFIDWYDSYSRAMESDKFLKGGSIAASSGLSSKTGWIRKNYDELENKVRDLAQKKDDKYTDLEALADSIALSAGSMMTSVLPKQITDTFARITPSGYDANDPQHVAYVAALRDTVSKKWQEKHPFSSAMGSMIGSFAGFGAQTKAIGGLLELIGIGRKAVAAQQTAKAYMAQGKRAEAAIMFEKADQFRKSADRIKHTAGIVAGSTQIAASKRGGVEFSGAFAKDVAIESVKLWVTLKVGDKAGALLSSTVMRSFKPSLEFSTVARAGAMALAGGTANVVQSRAMEFWDAAFHSERPFKQSYMDIMFGPIDDKTGKRKGTPWQIWAGEFGIGAVMPLIGGGVKSHKQYVNSLDLVYWNRRQMAKEAQIKGWNAEKTEIGQRGIEDMALAGMTPKMREVFEKDLARYSAIMDGARPAVEKAVTQGIAAKEAEDAAKAAGMDMTAKAYAAQQVVVEQVIPTVVDVVKERVTRLEGLGYPPESIPTISEKEQQRIIREQIRFKPQTEGGDSKKDEGKTEGVSTLQKADEAVRLPEAKVEPPAAPSPEPVTPATAKPAKQTTPGNPSPLVGPVLTLQDGSVLAEGKIGAEHKDLMMDALSKQDPADSSPLVHAFKDADGKTLSRTEAAQRALDTGLIDQAKFNEVMARKEPGLTSQDLRDAAEKQKAAAPAAEQPAPAPVAPPAAVTGSVAPLPSDIIKALLSRGHEVVPSGPANLKLRRDIIEAITGKRPPANKAGVNAVTEALAKHLGVDTKQSKAGVDDAIREKLRGMQEASTSTTKESKKRTLPKLPEATGGAWDIIDAIQELGGLRSRQSQQRKISSQRKMSASQAWKEVGGEYDGETYLPEGLRAHVLQKSGGVSPDEAAQILFGANIIRESDPGLIYSNLNDAWNSRKKFAKQSKEQEAQWKAMEEHYKSEEAEIRAEDLPENELMDPVDVWPEFDTVAQADEYIDKAGLSKSAAEKESTAATTGEAAKEAATQPQGETDSGATAKAAAPRLRAGEKATGELFQGEDQAFNLAGERLVESGQGISEKQAAEKEAAENKKRQDEQQGNMPFTVSSLRALRADLDAKLTGNSTPEKVNEDGDAALASMPERVRARVAKNTADRAVGGTVEQLVDKAIELASGDKSMLFVLKAMKETITRMGIGARKVANLWFSNKGGLHFSSGNIGINPMITLKEHIAAVGHEVAHYIDADAIDKYLKGDVEKLSPHQLLKIRELRHAMDTARAAAPESIRKILEANIPTAEKLKQLMELKDASGNPINIRQYYGSTDLREFHAEILTDRTYQNTLSQIPTTPLAEARRNFESGGKSLLQSVKESLMGLIRGKPIPKTSLAETSFEQAFRLILDPTAWNPNGGAPISATIRATPRTPEDQSEEVQLRGADMERAMVMFGESLYAKNLSNTVGKELFQNSVDATKKTGPATEKLIVYGNKNKVFFMADNGVGMSPDVILNYFLRAFVSGKSVGEGGGYGLAKLAILGGPKEYKVVSVGVDKQGRKVKTTLTGTGKGFLEFNQNPPKVAIAPDSAIHLSPELMMRFSYVPDATPTGTVAEFTLKEDNAHQASGAVSTGIPFIEGVSFSNATQVAPGERLELQDEYKALMPLLSEFNWRPVNSVSVAKMKAEDRGGWSVLHSVSLPHADIDIIAREGSKIKKQQWISFAALNRSIFQFRSDVSLQEEVALPEGIAVNIKPKVAAGTADYAFTTSREALIDSVNIEITKFFLSAGREAMRKLNEKYEKAKDSAIPIGTTGKVFLDAGSTVPDSLAMEIADHPDTQRVLQDVDRIQSAILNMLWKKFGTKKQWGGSFGRARFAGLLAGANAYGVHFGKPRTDEPTTIYHDVWKEWKMAYEEFHEIENNDPEVAVLSVEEKMRFLYDTFLTKVAGVSFHEALHQTVDSEGEPLARELTFKAGDIVETVVNLIKSPHSYEDIVSIANTLDRDAKRLEALQNAQAGGEFITSQGGYDGYAMAVSPRENRGGKGDEGYSQRRREVTTPRATPRTPSRITPEEESALDRMAEDMDAVPWTPEQRKAGSRTIYRYSRQRTGQAEPVAPSSTKYPSAQSTGERAVSALKSGDIVDYNGDREVQAVRESSDKDRRWIDFTDGNSIHIGRDIRLPYIGRSDAVSDKARAAKGRPESAEAATKDSKLSSEAQVAETPVIRFTPRTPDEPADEPTDENSKLADAAKKEFEEYQKAQAHMAGIGYPAGTPAPPSIPIKPLSQIIRDVAKGLDIPIRFGRLTTTKYGGYFKKLQNLIGAKRANDIQIVSHEVGHKLDEVFSLSKYPKIKAELMVLGDPATPGSMSSWTKNKTLKYKLGEGVAEFVRYWITDPAGIAKGAPLTNAYFERALDTNKDFGDVMRQAREDYQTWLKAPLVARLASRISIGSNPNKTRYGLTQLTRDLVDDLHILRLVFDDAARLSKKDILPSKNGYLLARLLRGSYGMADKFIRSGVVKFETKDVTLGTSFEDAVKDVAGRIDKFRLWITAKRAAELQSQGRETGIKPEEVKATLDEYGSEPGFQEAFDKLKAWNDAVLQYAVDSGYIGEKNAEAMRNMNQDYVPFHRIFEIGAGESPSQESGGTGRGLNVGKTDSFMALKGSMRDIVDPLETMIKNAYTIISASEKAAINRSVADLADVEGMGKWVERIATPKTEVKVDLETVRKQLEDAGADLSAVPEEILLTFHQNSGRVPYGENIIKVTTAGETTFYRIGSNDLFDTFHALDVDDSGRLLKILSQPAHILRAGVTLDPAFALSNVIRDAFGSAVINRYGMKPFEASIRGIAALLRNPQLVAEWGASGAEQSFESSFFDREKMAKFMRERITKDMTKKEQAAKLIMSPLAALRYLGGIAESATRIGEFDRAYKKAIKRGMPVGEARRLAAFESRDRQDFAKGGAKTKALRGIAAFWNAGLQGNIAVAQAFKDRPIRSILQGTAFITIPSMILMAVNYDDKDYWDRPQWERDAFWLVPAGKDANNRTRFLRIPKPFVLGQIFGSLPERVMSHQIKTQPEAFEGIARSILKETMPDPTPNFANVIIATVRTGKQGWDVWRDQPIVPDAIAERPLELQYTEQTSLTAKKVGALLGISPMKIDYAISGSTGGVGKQLTHNVIDQGISAVTGEKPTATRVLPGARFLTVPAGISSQAVSDFYEKLTELRQEEAGAKFLKKGFKKKGKLDAMEAAARLMSDYRKMASKAKDADAKQRYYLKIRALAEKHTRVR